MGKAALFWGVLFVAGCSLSLGGLAAEWLGSVTGEVSLMGVPLVGLLASVWKQARSAVGPLDLKLNRFVIDPKYRERTGFMDVFREDFRKIIEMAIERQGRLWRRRADRGEELPLNHELGDPARLVIFIDDLDRCTPPRSCDIIEAISVILDSPGCVFVLGMDAEMVRASVETKYKPVRDYLENKGGGSDARLGQNFLEKVVQVNFRIPPPDSDQIGGYFGSIVGNSGGSKRDIKEDQKHAKGLAAAALAADIGSLKTAVEAAAKGTKRVSPKIIHEAVRQAAAERFTEESKGVVKAIRGVVEVLEPNPRKIKRFVNIFRLRATVAEILGKFTEQITPELLARWVYLGMEWPDEVHSPGALVEKIGRVHAPSDGKATPKDSLDPALVRLLKQWPADTSEKTIKDLRWL